jgi:hypothetical protein
MHLGGIDRGSTSGSGAPLEDLQHLHNWLQTIAICNLIGALSRHLLVVRHNFVT